MPQFEGFVVQGLRGLVFRGSGPPGRSFSSEKFLGSFDVQGTPSCCGISGDLALSTRKSLAIAIVRFCCAKPLSLHWRCRGPVPVRLPAAAPGNHSACFRVRWVSATMASRVCDIAWLLVMGILLSVSMSLSPCHAFRVGEVTGQSSRVHD